MRRALTIMALAGSIVLLILIGLRIWSARFAMSSYETIAQHRDELARDGKTVIKVAVVWPQGTDADSDSLWNGANLAAYEINQCGLGGQLDPQDINKCLVAGRKRPILSNGVEKTIELERYCPMQGEEINLARELSEDPELVAVVGHSTPELAKFVSIPYQYTELLYINVNATDAAITNHGFGYVFRNMPGDDEFAQVIASVATKDNERVGVFNALSPHALDSVNTNLAFFGRSAPHFVRAFQKSYETGLCPAENEASATLEGYACRAGCLRCDIGDDSIKGLLYYIYRRVTLTTTITCRQRNQNLRDTVNAVRDSINASGPATPDLILVSDDNGLNASRLINELRAQKLSQPVIGAVGLDSNNLALTGVSMQPLLFDDSWFHRTSPASNLSYQSQAAEKQNGFTQDRAVEIISTISSPGAPRLRFPDQMVALIKQEIDNELSGGKGNSLAISDNNSPVLTSIAAHAAEIRSSFTDKRVPEATGLYLALVDSRLEPCRTASSGANADSQATADASSQTSRCSEAAKAVADELATRRAALGTDGLGALLAVISTRYPDDPVLRLPTSQKPQDRENYFWSQLFASGPNAQAPDAPANFVARFVAAATIAENPKDFGLSAQPVYLEQLLPDTIYVASVFSPDLDLPGVRDFVSKFNQYYKSRDGAAHPDLLAAQGYEAINLLGQANEMSHSVAPKDVAAVLKANTFSSITGDVAFKANGDIKGKQIILKAFRKK